METQITMKIQDTDKEIIKKASKLIGLSYSSFCRTVAISKAREIIIRNI